MSKTIFLFPGQGSQYVGMGKALEKFPAGKRLLDMANEVLGFDLVKLMFEGPADELMQTQNTQPAMYVTSMMSFALLQDREIAFDYVAGHSLGEYSALCAAEALSFEDGLKLVRLRGELMAQAGEKQPGSMSAILGFEKEKLEAIFKDVSSHGVVVAANYNTPSQIVISGSVAAVTKAGELIKEAGAKKVIPLPVSGAFHSPLMEYAKAGLQGGLDKVDFRSPTVPVITNVEAEPCQVSHQLMPLLVEQLTSPVRWVEVIQKAISLGCTQAYEVGAGKVLMGLARGISRDLTVKPVESEQDLESGV